MTISGMRQACVVAALRPITLVALASHFQKHHNMSSVTSKSRERIYRRKLLRVISREFLNHAGLLLPFLYACGGFDIAANY